MNISIIDADKLDGDTALLLAALERAKRWENAKLGTLYVNERGSNGWLEYILVLELGVGRFTIGCIQRNVGEPCEFHS